jgi:hypothetical protein
MPREVEVAHDVRAQLRAGMQRIERRPRSLAGELAAARSRRSSTSTLLPALAR